jgi:ribosomal protein S18 acetylase RimI-like enzyme
VDTDAIMLVPVSEAHFEAILRLEREAGRSLIALTEGHALREAHARGHELILALADGDVAGWIWYGRSLERGAEEIGQIYRVAVASASRRSGVGRALLARAIADLTARGCSRVQATVDGSDEAAQALFADASFNIDSLTMDRPL